MIEHSCFPDSPTKVLELNLLFRLLSFYLSKFSYVNRRIETLVGHFGQQIGIGIVGDSHCPKGMGIGEGFSRFLAIGIGIVGD